MSFQTIHDPFPLGAPLVIFGAGPLPRNRECQSWHKDMDAFVQDAVAGGRLPEGTVYVSPEPPEGCTGEQLADQWKLEQYFLARADVVLFWMDRNMPNRPGLTTNWEAGERYRLPWAFMGGPVEGYQTTRNRYPLKRWEALGRTWAFTMAAIVDQVSTWYARQQKESTFATLAPVQDTPVPLSVRLSRDFGSWHRRIEQAGNLLKDFDVRWAYGVGPGERILFSWAAQVDIEVPSEQRNKTNEFVYSRREFSSIALFSRGPAGVRILLAGEFRSPMGDIYWGLPAGSSFSPTKTPQQIAAAELEEETGIAFPVENFKFAGSIPVAAVIAGTETSLWSIEVSDEDMDAVDAATQGKTFGVVEETERTYPRVFPLNGLPPMDAVNLGLIFKAITGA
jgi:8-oxo-dGTP pyrophosphatase MutT (NUDIX family)